MLDTAKLSGFIQSQDNDRQRAQRLASDGAAEAPRTITRVKLYLPCEVLTGDRISRRATKPVVAWGSGRN